MSRCMFVEVDGVQYSVGDRVRCRLAGWRDNKDGTIIKLYDNETMENTVEVIFDWSCIPLITTVTCLIKLREEK